ncbi:Osmotically-inducible lipoprotein B [Paraburkholderia sabiae]|jgi:osmotically inducible lipoprotein OsmB|nr:Osmotically-inducible lipoprotein B [Paraburkholderia sabiae]
MQGHDMWKRYIVRAAIAAVALVPFVTGCTVGGAAAGGYVGHETTHSTVGTVGGAVAGGIIGHELGK